MVSSVAAPTGLSTVVVVAMMCLAATTVFVPYSSTPQTPRHPLLENIIGSGAGAPAAAASGSVAACSLVVSFVGVVAAATMAVKAVRRSPSAPPTRASLAVALQAFETELGVQAPTGFWDPLGFTKTMTPDSFRRRRYVEVKHGRVSMLACMGFIVPEYFKFDGFLSPSLNIKFSDVPNGLGAFSKVPLSGWAQMVTFAGLIELFYFVDDPKRAPGDFAKAGQLGIPNAPGIADPAVKKKKLSSELANGRLAMMAIIGMFYQNGLTGTPWGDWSLYTDSPLRSGVKSPGYNTLPEMEMKKTGFAGNVGDQPPLGFWDPLGFTKDRDVEKFKRRREVELKHGRVAMFATIGYIVPEYFKFPGYLSPSTGLKFADVPNGLKALSVIPQAGLAQFAAFIAFIELVYNKSNAEPGNYGKGLFGLGSLGLSASVPDPAQRAKKLSAEVSNGRLAMMAIIGMFFQDGLTGSAWGDWALYTASPLRAL